MCIRSKKSLRRLKGLLFSLAVELAVVFALGELQGRESEGIEKRFLEEAPRFWEEYRAYSDRLDGLVSTLITKDEEKKILIHSRQEFKHNAHCRLVSEQSLSDKSLRGASGELLATNSLYTFRLFRKAINNPWVLKEIDLHTDGKPTADNEKEMTDSMSAKQRAIYANKIALAALLQQSTFRLLRATLIVRGGAELVKVEFDNSHPFDPRARPFIPIHGGALVLDPAHCWCLHSCDLREKWVGRDAKVTVTIEYQDASAKYPIPKRSITTEYYTSTPVTEGYDPTRKSKSPFTQIHVTDYELSEPSNLPADSEFTLSAFGLPEPFGVEEPRRTKWYIWAASAGFVCLALGFLIRYRYRRAA